MDGCIPNLIPFLIVCVPTNFLVGIFFVFVCVYIFKYKKIIDISKKKIKKLFGIFKIFTYICCVNVLMDKRWKEL